MKIIQHKNYQIRQDGTVLNSKTNNLLYGYINTNGDVYINLCDGSGCLKNIIARLFFDYSTVFQSLIKVKHINDDKLDNSCFNLKVIPKKGKTDLYIYLDRYFKICVSDKGGKISEFKNISMAYNYILTLCQ